MPDARPLRGWPQLAWHSTLALALVPRWLLVRDRRRRRALEQRFFRRCLQGIGVTVAPSGTPVGGGGTLFVANHISFTDILALAALIDVRFVAKMDVRHWPVIGWLAARLGTIFVDRSSRRDTAAVAEAIAAALGNGQDVLVFPEGTTSDGADVLAFRPSLLETAGCARQVQPVALAYSDGPARAYVGDESLGANLLRLAPQRAIVTVQFLPPLARLSRKDLAVTARAAICDARAAGPRSSARPGAAEGTGFRGSVPT